MNSRKYICKHAEGVRERGKNSTISWLPGRIEKRKTILFKHAALRIQYQYIHKNLLHNFNKSNKLKKRRFFAKESGGTLKNLAALT